MFVPEPSLTFSAAASAPPESLFLLSARNGVVVRSDGSFLPPALSDLLRCGLLSGNSRALRLGVLGGVPCFCSAQESEAIPPSESGLIPCSVRTLLASAPPDACEAACRARELLHWRRLHRFCGACSGPLRESDRDMALLCPACGAAYYPQIAPAVIVAILRSGGREILLAHNRKFEPEVYSLIAGFVECGETAERAAHREIAEETGIRVRNLRYLTSQPWPFPNSLMLAYSAEWESGDPRPDGAELSDCAWFDLKRLPKLPAPGSVARRMIASLAAGTPL